MHEMCSRIFILSLILSIASPQALADLRELSEENIKRAGRWAYQDPPKVLYKIDCSIDTEEGLLKGQEIVRFTNTTSQPVRNLALMGLVHGNEGLEIAGNGKPAVYVKMVRKI